MRRLLYSMCLLLALCAGADTLSAADETNNPEEETCHKYLPLIGSVVEVPCEAPAEDDASDAYAPKISCDELAGDEIALAKVREQGATAVSSCRAAVSLYPQTRRFKWQLARALFVTRAYDEAHQLCQSLANEGQAKAMNCLGVMYRNGQGVSKDQGQAIEWFRKAAQKHDAHAENNLGLAYQNGQGVGKD
jgi:TPR repeat protein